MRTSNKILLGIFLSPLLVIAAINLALYAKYKSGHYVSMATIEHDRYMRQTLKNIRHVAVYGLNNFTVGAADTTRLEIEKDDHGHLHYTIKGDSLIIHGDSTAKKNDNSADEMMRSNQNVSLHLPGEINIIADNSNIYLHGSKDSSKAQSVHLYLRNSSNFEIPDGDFDSKPAAAYINELSVETADASSIELSGAATINLLTLALTNSQFDDKSAVIGKLIIRADKTSSLTLKGGNLQKLYP